MERKSYEMVSDLFDALHEEASELHGALVGMNDTSYIGRVALAAYITEIAIDREIAIEAMFTEAGWTEAAFWAEVGRRAEIAIRREYDEAVAKVAAVA